jgi:hypothetical protein
MIGSLLMLVSGIAAASAGEGFAKVSVHDLRCIEGEGATRTLLGGFRPVDRVGIIGGPKIELTHHRAWAMDCDQELVNEIKDRAAQFYMFAPAHVAVRSRERLVPTQTAGMCEHIRQERVAITFSVDDQSLSVVSTESKELGLVPCDGR